MAPAARLFLAALIVAFLQIGLASKVVFFEPFDEDYADRWIVSNSNDYGGKWKWAPGESTGDYGLLVSEKAKKYGIATELPEPVDPTKDTLVLQYDVRLQNNLDCGGAYLKFLMPQEAGWTPSQFNDASPYSIMFGPDKCGSTNKVHFIFRHKSPKTGEYVEHHLKSPPTPLTFDKQSHVYTAVVHPNNTLHILIDGEIKAEADLLSGKDFVPPVLPPKTIPDPEDKKPEDWDDLPKIQDPDASKPDDWDESAPREIADEEASKPEGWLDDEPEEVDDPDATKPDDWDDEEDGEWEPPKVPNPKCEEAPGCGAWRRPLKRNPAYKGKWSAPMIDNPAYKGVWKPRDIPNPEFFELERPNLETVAAVGIEIWTMADGILFDNILVTDDPSVAARLRSERWQLKQQKEREAEKAKREAEDNKAKEEGKGGKGALGAFQTKFFEALHKLADTPALAPVKKQLKDLISKGEEFPLLAIGVVVTLPLLPFLLLLPVLFSSSRPAAAEVSVERAKKEDITPADDAPDATAVASSAAAAAAAAATSSREDEIQPEESIEAEAREPEAAPDTAAAAVESEPAGDGSGDEGEVKVRRRPRRA